MPKWLRPIGGSGISGQPAFMISDKVIFNCSDGKGAGGGKETSVWRGEERLMCIGMRECRCRNRTKVLIRVRIMDFLEETMANENLDFRFMAEHSKAERGGNEIQIVDREGFPRNRSFFSG